MISMQSTQDYLDRYENLWKTWRCDAALLLDLEIEHDAIKRAAERGDIDDDLLARGAALVAALPPLRDQVRELRAALAACRTSPEPDRSFKGEARRRRDAARFAAIEEDIAREEFQIARAAAERLAPPDRRRRPAVEVAP